VSAVAGTRYAVVISVGDTATMIDGLATSMTTAVPVSEPHVTIAIRCRQCRGRLDMCTAEINDSAQTWACPHCAHRYVWRPGYRIVQVLARGHTEEPPKETGFLKKPGFGTTGCVACS
jgi:DNA-directed RNA polymerase subunit RPC12/RpoP